MHQIFDELDVKELDHTHSRGTKCIDSIAATPNIRKHMEGSRLFETNEMTITDHRVCVVDINLEQYFQEEFSGWDKIERVVLCPSKRNHRNKFDETGDETLDSITLESTIQTIIISAVAKKKLEQLE